MITQSQGHFKNVPKEILHLMLYLLDCKDLVKLAKTSKYFHQLAQDIFNTPYGEGLLYGYWLKKSSDKMSDSFKKLFNQIRNELIREYRAQQNRVTNEIVRPTNTNNLIFIISMVVLAGFVMRQLAATFEEPSALNIMILGCLSITFMALIATKLLFVSSVRDQQVFLENGFNDTLFATAHLNDNQRALVASFYNQFKYLFLLDNAREDLLQREELFSISSCINNNENGIAYHLQEFTKLLNPTWLKEESSFEVRQLREFVNSSRLFSSWAHQNPNSKLLIPERNEESFITDSDEESLKDNKKNR